MEKLLKEYQRSSSGAKQKLIELVVSSQPRDSIHFSIWNRAIHWAVIVVLLRLLLFVVCYISWYLPGFMLCSKNNKMEDSQSCSISCLIFWFLFNESFLVQGDTCVFYFLEPIDVYTIWVRFRFLVQLYDYC